MHLRIYLYLASENGKRELAKHWTDGNRKFNTKLVGNLAAPYSYISQLETLYEKEKQTQVLEMKIMKS